MGNLGAKAVGVEKPPVTLDESVNGIVKVVKEARSQAAGLTVALSFRMSYNE
jgi:hypothetical protein